MTTLDILAIVMSVTGLIFGCLNYVTLSRSYSDDYYESKRPMTIFIIEQAFRVYLLTALCWYLERFL